MTQSSVDKIKALGLWGYGGACGAAAIEINRRVFGGRGTYVAGLNEFWLERGRAIGHVAVLHGGRYYDSGGRISKSDLLDHGMLDPEDPAHRHPEMTEEDAEKPVLVAFDDDEEVLRYFPACEVPRNIDMGPFSRLPSGAPRKR